MAIQDNPKHAYLKNYLSHIEFVKEKTVDSLVNQYQKHVGTYGPREFWIEDNKFYYKRRNETTELPKYELLPIDGNRYMDITRTGTIMAFENDDNGNEVSRSYSYYTDSFEWKPSVTGENYFLKEN